MFVLLLLAWPFYLTVNGRLATYAALAMPTATTTPPGTVAPTTG
jgi:hypothetical protein